MKATLEANVGNLVNILGSKSWYSGLDQLRVEEELLVAADDSSTATNIDAMALDSETLEDYKGQLVELTGMVIVDVYEDSYGNLNLH